MLFFAWLALILVQVTVYRLIQIDLEKLRWKIMATQAELAAQLKANAEQAAKIGGETRTLLTKIQELLDQLANQSGVTPELQTAADDLKAQLQVVDDLVPDAPTPPPPTP